MKIRIVFAFLICVFVVTPLLAQGPPDGSGAVVTRSEESTYWNYFDPSQGLLAIHGFSLCEWNCPPFPAPPAIPLTDLLWVLPPTDECVDWWDPDAEEWVTFCLEHLVAKADDQHTEVWDETIFTMDWPEPFCSYVCDPQNAIGIGTARFHVTANDWYDVSEKRALSINASAHGTVIDPDGNTKKFYGRVKVVAKGDKFKEEIKIILR